MQTYCCILFLYLAQETCSTKITPFFGNKNKLRLSVDLTDPKLPERLKKGNFVSSESLAFRAMYKGGTLFGHIYTENSTGERVTLDTGSSDIVLPATNDLTLEPLSPEEQEDFLYTTDLNEEESRATCPASVPESFFCFRHKYLSDYYDTVVGKTEVCLNENTGAFCTDCLASRILGASADSPREGEADLSVGVVGIGFGPGGFDRLDFFFRFAQEHQETDEEKVLHKTLGIVNVGEDVIEVRIGIRDRTGFFWEKMLPTTVHNTLLEVAGVFFGGLKVDSPLPFLVQKREVPQLLVLLDTGTNLLLVPSTLFDFFMLTIKSALQKVKEDTPDFRFSVERISEKTQKALFCFEKTARVLFELQLVNLRLQTDLAEFLLFENDKNMPCGVLEGNARIPFIIMGYPFFHKMSLFYDNEKGLVGLKSDSGEVLEKKAPLDFVPFQAMKKANKRKLRDAVDGWFLSRRSTLEKEVTTLFFFSVFINLMLLFLLFSWNPQKTSARYVTVKK